MSKTTWKIHLAPGTTTAGDQSVVWVGDTGLLDVGDWGTNREIGGDISRLEEIRSL